MFFCFYFFLLRKNAAFGGMTDSFFSIQLIAFCPLFCAPSGLYLFPPGFAAAASFLFCRLGLFGMADATRTFCRQHDGTGNNLSILFVDGTLLNGQVVDDRLVSSQGLDSELPRDGQTTRITVFSPNRNAQIGMWQDPTGEAAAQLFRLAQEARAERSSLASEASRAADERQHLYNEATQASAERAQLQARLDSAAEAFSRASAEQAETQAQLDAANAELGRASAERASLREQITAATAAANAASQQAAHVVSATASHRIELDERMASVEQASRAQSRAASPDASNPAIARAQAAAEHARQQSEAASLRVSNIERASANDRSRLEALESLPARMSEMQHAFLELSATMGTISKALGGRGTATNPIDVSSSSASYHQQPSSFQQVPVSFVSSASTNDPSTIMLQRLVETGSEVVGTLSPPLGVLDPFLPNATIDAIQSLPNQYRWFRKGASAEKLRTALGDIATWISGPEESAASASPANPRARAERWLRDNRVRLSTAEWLVFREGSLQSALELAVSKKRNNPDLFPFLLASRHPKSDVTTLTDYASGSALLNGDELWGGNKALADKARSDKADKARADRAAAANRAAADPGARGRGRGGGPKRAVS